ncbi:unnamed protein product [Cylindrotheca closterium]|uniref:Rhodanese domain-containing protein n=1 Tax=Cylindrotheca closterium TaxID=2856 RepID=A0AAD2JKQ3_9STRA|nr:unnamed protein product [Cylindrotheca closterium]
MVTKEDEEVVIENSRSVAFRNLPPVPEGAESEGCILLFYQYKEPVWTKKEHKKAIKTIIALGEECNVTGRGRVAPEGVNCTLSGRPEDVRNFCYGLRKWNPLFDETDFKLTDFVPKNKLFKSLSIRKTEELVAYGLAGEKAPSLEKFHGTHLEAEDYHNAMKDKDTVVVDVRNAYESAIGSFKPPEGGAELIDPKMRNSIEFPKWLNDPKTQEKLNGKKVLMYCTGGIRCERATALLNQMTTVNPDLNVKGVYHMRGGIERYVKTFPKGGFWNGKNYLFDRRMEQVPGTKDGDRVEQEVDSKCSVCRRKWTAYRGKFKCSQSLCGVPVIVCPDCDSFGLKNPDKLNCELCKQGYRAPTSGPDLVELKRKAESIAVNKDGGTDSSPESKKAKKDGGSNHHHDRLFLARLPLTISKSKLIEVLVGSASADKIKRVHWLADKNSGAFYGSCIVEVSSSDIAKQVIDKASENGGIKLDKKKIRASFASAKEGEIWPPKNYVEKEFPPVVG